MEQIEFYYLNVKQILGYLKGQKWNSITLLLVQVPQGAY